MSFLKELWEFMRVRRKYWLAPIVLLLLVFGGARGRVLDQNLDSRVPGHGPALPRRIESRNGVGAGKGMVAWLWCATTGGRARHSIPAPTRNERG
jgi:hypothetical protein